MNQGFYLNIIIHISTKVILFFFFFPSLSAPYKYSGSFSSIYNCKDFVLLLFSCFITHTGPFNVEINGEQIIFQAVQTHQGKSLLCLERLADVSARAGESYCCLSWFCTLRLHSLSQRGRIQFYIHGNRNIISGTFQPRFFGRQTVHFQLRSINILHIT